MVLHVEILQYLHHKLLQQNNPGCVSSTRSSSNQVKDMETAEAICYMLLRIRYEWTQTLMNKMTYQIMWSW
jgi:hypothetical protein